MAVFSAIGAALFGAGTFLAGLTAAGLQIVAGIALNAFAKSAKGEAQPSRFAVQGKIQGGDDVPRSIGFGWSTTAGSLVYQNEWGVAGQTTNAFSTRVIALYDYPVDEMVGLYVDGAPVTVLWGEAGSYGAPVQEYRRGGVDHLWVKFYDGTQTAADSFLTGTVASAERPWGSTRVGYGVPYLIATSLTPEQKDGEDPLFSGFPAYKVTTYGTKLYDPSKDTTAGGSGSHRWDNPSTWGGDGDFLPPVQIYNLLRGVRVDGDWLYGLQDLSAERLPAANWIAAINKARALIAGPDGNEATYRAGGELQVGAPINVAIEALLTACQGRLVETGGTYKIFIGEPGDSVAAFSDDDIISTEEQHFTPFYGLADTINGVQATYPNPAEGWNTKTAPALLRPDLEAKDGNRRLMASVSLDMVPYGGQVQRLMKSALLEGLRARRQTITLGPEFWALEPGDVVTWTSARNGYDEKLFRVDGVADKANLDVIVDMTEVDPSDYDWDQEADYTPVIDGPLVVVPPAAQPMSGWAVEPATIKDENGGNRRPSIRITYDGLQSDVVGVDVQVRVAGDELPFAEGRVPYRDPYSTLLPWNFSANTAYEVRGVYVPGTDRAMTWSNWLGVTTDDVRLGPNDIDIELDDIAAGLAEDLKFMRRNVRAALAKFDQLGTLLAEQDVANFHDRRTLRRELKLQIDDAVAGFDEIIELALGPGGAIAQKFETVYAALGGNSAAVLVRFVATAAPDGVAAQWSVQLSTDGETFANAGLYLQIDELGNSQIVLDADRTLISTDGGTTVSAMFDEDGALIRNLRVGRIEGPGGLSYWDLSTGDFRIST